MNKAILIKNGTIVTMDRNDSLLIGDLLIRDGKIARLEREIPVTVADRVIDAGGCGVLPGFIQTHIHLCQTLFRNAADDLSLIDWLQKKIWPMEAAHTPESIRASARLGLVELIKGGTTNVLTMETVNHTEEVFKIVEEFHVRATVGKCMMDAGDGVPRALQEKTGDSVTESIELMHQWNERAGGLIRYCFAPRFAVSCTRELLSRVAALAREHKVMIHTHSNESLQEIAIIKHSTGRGAIEYLASVGFAAPYVMLAHCVHLDEREMEILASTETRVAHCPSSNLKLGSGIAPVNEMLDHGINVTFGADGAACNNRLDMFTEMRLASLLQKVKGGPTALPARRTLRMATIDGATALGLGDKTGSIELGKCADITILDLHKPHILPLTDIYSAIVYSATPADVRSVIIDGRVVLLDGQMTAVDEAQVRSEAQKQAAMLIKQVENIC